MFDLPFVPSRRALVSSKALQDFAALNLKDEFHEVRPLCFSCTDRGVMHANQPIRTVEDIKDLKIHVPTQRAGEAMHLLGAEPVPMPTGQLVLAVNQNVIEGCLDPWHIMPALRLNDILKTHTEFSDTSPSSTTFVLAMNSAAYDRLPRDLKAVIDGNSGQVAAGMAGTMWDIEAASVADSVARGGDSIVTLLPEAVAHWRKLTEPVVEKWLKEMKEQKTDGGKLIAAAHAVMLKYVKEPEPQPPQAPQQQAPQQDAVTQPPQSAAPPQTTSPQIKPQPAPPQTSSAAPKINAPAPATTASTTPPNAAPAHCRLSKHRRSRRRGLPSLHRQPRRHHPRRRRPSPSRSRPQPPRRKSQPPHRRKRLRRHQPPRSRRPPSPPPRLRLHLRRPHRQSRKPPPHLRRRSRPSLRQQSPPRLP